ncbi:uncharacterized protein LOC125759503 [Rhipicephalus sanguineus]|uniref:uncharacterized protein LOC125759503 n=1 Tax=Rhipicephalus sanguineus TaxID=34632 RepID=UPI0020C2676F|nr:uncharacterized protein LOC125759503 [Rhipicephalus sanguineus]
MGKGLSATSHSHRVSSYASVALQDKACRDAIVSYSLNPLNLATKTSQGERVYISATSAKWSAICFFELARPVFQRTPSLSEASFFSTEAEAASQPSDVVGEELHSRLTRTDWCDCEHCVVLDNFSEEECLCCREMGDPVTAAQPEGCVTENPEFHLKSKHRCAPYFEQFVDQDQLHQVSRF